MTSFDISQPEVLIGLLIGGMMVYLFAALAIEAVGRRRRRGRGGAPAVPEKPGIMDRTEKPDYAKAVDIVTASGQRDDRARADPDRHPVVVGLLDAGARRAADRRDRGLLRRGLDDRRRRRWDNAKKLIEDGEYGGKGSEAHAASVTGDTVGDPYKDTAGPRSTR